MLDNSRSQLLRIAEGVYQLSDSKFPPCLHSILHRPNPFHVMSLSARKISNVPPMIPIDLAITDFNAVRPQGTSGVESTQN